MGEMDEMGEMGEMSEVDEFAGEKEEEATTSFYTHESQVLCEL